MSYILEFPAFTLKRGVSETDFLRVHEKFNREFMAKQKGYISHSLLRDDKAWYDLAVWESAEAMETAFKDIYENASAKEYIALIDQIGADDEIPLFTVVKNY